MNRARRQRRSPFVVTVAVAAAAVGCGGQTDADSDGSGGSGGWGGSGANPPYIPCPDTPPEVGSDCTGGGWSETHCEYGTESCTSQLAFDCVAGKWTASTEIASCDCPASEPADGAGCSAEGLQCPYPAQDSCETSRMATCTASGWLVTSVGTGGCNPPPPPVEECPAQEPTIGGYCNVLSSQICTYPDQCCGTSLRCENNTWQDIGLECNPPPPVCPAEPPADGSACMQDPCSSFLQPCQYDQCSKTGTQTVATCAGTIWSVTSAPCPEP